MECEVSHTWVDGQYGLLAEIIDMVRYLMVTNFNYVEPLVHYH